MRQAVVADAAEDGAPVPRRLHREFHGADTHRERHGDGFTGRAGDQHALAATRDDVAGQAQHRRFVE